MFHYCHTLSVSLSHSLSRSQTYLSCPLSFHPTPPWKPSSSPWLNRSGVENTRSGVDNQIQGVVCHDGISVFTFDPFLPPRHCFSFEALFMWRLSPFFFVNIIRVELIKEYSEMLVVNSTWVWTSYYIIHCDFVILLSTAAKSPSTKPSSSSLRSKTTLPHLLKPSNSSPSISPPQHQGIVNLLIEKENPRFQFLVSPLI